MSIRQRANLIIQQVSFIIVRTKGDFILFYGVELILYVVVILVDVYSAWYG